jgi:hypothetical protein
MYVEYGYRGEVIEQAMAHYGIDRKNLGMGLGGILDSGPS